MVGAHEVRVGVEDAFCLAARGVDELRVEK
jgi:hypothetical protein